MTSVTLFLPSGALRGFALTAKRTFTLLVLLTPPATESWYVQDQSSGKVTPESSRPSEM